jgi:hypothetical protein
LPFCRLSPVISPSECRGCRAPSRVPADPERTPSLGLTPASLEHVPHETNPGRDPWGSEMSGTAAVAAFSGTPTPEAPGAAGKRLSGHPGILFLPPSAPFRRISLPPSLPPSILSSFSDACFFSLHAFRFCPQLGNRPIPSFPSASAGSLRLHPGFRQPTGRHGEARAFQKRFQTARKAL